MTYDEDLRRELEGLRRKLYEKQTYDDIYRSETRWQSEKAHAETLAWFKAEEAAIKARYRQ